MASLFAGLISILYNNIFWYNCFRRALPLCPFDREKFKSLVHYICWKAGDDPAKLGAIKLNKICWLADFGAFYATDQSITDARYVRRKFGPVPSAIQQVLQELKLEGALSIYEVEFHGHSKREFISLKPPNMSRFTDRELSYVDLATQFVCEKHTASSISDASHDHIWKAAADGEEIPYFTMFAKPGKITEHELEWAAQAIQSLPF